MNTLVFLTTQIQSLLNIHFMNYSSNTLQQALSLRIRRGLSLEGVIGGALAEVLIEADYSPDFINDFIESAIQTITLASLERSI